MHTRLVLVVLACVIAITQAQTIVKVVIDSADHTTLEALVIKAELVDALVVTSLSTLFAPTDTAFTTDLETIPATLKTKLTDDPINANHKALLQDVLKQHVISAAARILAADLPATAASKVTLSIGNPLTVKNVAPQIKAGDVEATVSPADINATNGVVHVIDKVLFPASCYRTVVGVANGSTDHTTLVGLLTAADLVATLSNDTVGTGYTVFAPTNAAFAKIDTAITNCLRLSANKDHLVNLLKYHVVGSTVVASGLADGDSITSLDTAADKYKYASTGNTLTPFDGTASKITTTNLLATNGVVHVIDTVLIPKGLIAKLVCPSVVTVVVESAAHETLEALVIRADLATALAATNTQFTVFAPTDTAFTALPAGDLKSKLTADPIGANHKALLQDVLKFHVISAATATLQADVVALVSLLPVDRVSTAVAVAGRPDAMVGVAGTVDVTVTTFDLTAPNGVVHVIGSVLLPPSCSRTVVGIATTSTDHTTLVALLTAADLVATLSIDTVDTGYTVFAPTNAAFAKIDAATVTCLSLPANKDHLVSLLKYHVVGSTVVAGGLTDGMEITSLDTNSTKYKFASSGNTLTSDGTAAKIITTDLLATNGVVHIIDTVLIPKGFVANLGCGTPAPSVSSASSSSSSLAIVALAATVAFAMFT
eukprot:CAMPEP_0173100782 /NCGR_PEP_ID=MMETSP1102-20130122/36421_1 /TAXON_ID=49646 /ORGANISM="Geminigera sp., Strain Caron Lab Isolate" /LENGTH=656 /DNA_ID=CAMNT_0013994315 /DNA_START=1 /DNA_END=1970 /DNA_ORIENTATION=+